MCLLSDATCLTNPDLPTQFTVLPQKIDRHANSLAISYRYPLTIQCLILTSVLSTENLF